jgi:hypothetical protein
MHVTNTSKELATSVVRVKVALNKFGCRYYTAVVTSQQSAVINLISRELKCIRLTTNRKKYENM